MPSRRELLAGAAIGVAVVTAAGAGALAWSSTLLGEYSVMDMGDAATTSTAATRSTAEAGQAHPRHPAPPDTAGSVSVTR